MDDTVNLFFFFRFIIDSPEILNKLSKVKYEDQHITKLDKLKILNLIDSNKFDVVKISSFILLSPFLACISYRFAIFFLKIDNFLRYIFPGHLIYLELKKI